jgi:hypothetical protein
MKVVSTARAARTAGFHAQWLVTEPQKNVCHSDADIDVHMIALHCDYISMHTAVTTATAAAAATVALLATTAR